MEGEACLLCWVGKDGRPVYPEAVCTTFSEHLWDIPKRKSNLFLISPQLPIFLSSQMNLLSFLTQQT